MLDKVNIYSVLRDIVRNIWLIVLGALALGMIANVYYTLIYENTYITNSTIAVTRQSADSAVYSNLSAAQTMAEAFSNILNSELLQNRVCEDLDLDSFDAVVEASVVESTNLLTLKVTASSPYLAYSITRSIIDNYGDLTSYVTQTMVMQVLQQPQLPMSPDNSSTAGSQMRRWFVFGLIIFFILYVVLSIKKGTIRGIDEAADKLAAKPLGNIYHEKGRRNKSAKGGSCSLVNDVTASFDYIENFKKTAVAVANAADKISAKSIIFTSTVDGEGRSNVALNVALTLAKQHKNVVLIDADLRDPSLARLLNINVEHGIADLLEGKAGFEDVLIRDESTGMLMLPGNRRCKNAADLAAAPALGQYIRAFENKADYVIVDTPSMARIDTESIALITDMSVLVVGYDTVRASTINGTIDSLRSCSPKLAGVVLNDIKTLPGERRAVGNYRNYGNYGRYGSYGSYGRYGKYGRYGRYGAYGSYGAYGHYAHQDGDIEDDETPENGRGTASVKSGEDV